MKTRSRLSLLVVCSLMIGLFAFARVGLADPPGLLTSPPNHRHFLMTANGLIPVGPQVCQDASLQQAFNEFHYNVHHSEVPGIGEIPTLGPQDGAPGLHNGKGAEMIGVRGCG
jgi:hypothetical protein